MSGRTKDISAAYGAVAVTASDATVIPTTRSLMVGVAGNVAVRMANGDIATIAVPAGVVPLQVDKVYSTSTTATGITALY